MPPARRSLPALGESQVKRAPCDISVSLKVRTVLWAKDIYRAVKGPILANATKLHSEAVTAATAGAGAIFLECKIWLLEKLEAALVDVDGAPFSVHFKRSSWSCDFVNVSL